MTDDRNPKVSIKGISWFIQSFANFEEFNMFLKIHNIDISKLNKQELDAIELTRHGIAYVVMSNAKSATDYPRIKDYIESHLNPEKSKADNKMVIEWVEGN